MVRRRSHPTHARPYRLAVLAAVTLLSFGSVAPPVAEATYSIVARDPETGQVGAAVQSHWFSVARVIWVEPGLGAVATQSLVDWTYGPAGLDLLRLGRSSSKALEGLLASDTAPYFRQVAILDLDGEIVAHTGDRCIAEAGHHVGENYSVQANLMHHDTVPAAMADAFETTEGDLAEKLMAALEAAEAQGGDIRGQQSAALLVAGPENTGRPWEDYLFDLRIEDHAEPVKEMRRLIRVARAYEAMDEGDKALEEEDVDGAARAYRRAAELAPGNPEVLFWHAVSLANEGHLDRAEEVLAEVYEMDETWRELPARLVAPGILTIEPAEVGRLANAGR
ncbi:MAG: DUF1028 domain-containing protein [Gemmatimonadetes bacterium]|nr:DUF1028 domain-containing protein [Gemmatimonadota bacterium]